MSVPHVLSEMRLAPFSGEREVALRFMRIRAFSLRQRRGRAPCRATGEREARGHARPGGDHGDAAEDARRVSEVRALRGLLGHAPDTRRGRADDAHLSLCEVSTYVARVLSRRDVVREPL